MNTSTSMQQILSNASIHRLRRLKPRGLIVAGVIIIAIAGLGIRGCWNRGETAAIQRVLQADKASADEARRAMKAGADAVPVIDQMIRQSASIDLAGCPAEFAAAYERHRQAWREMALLMHSEPQSFLGGMGMGLLNSLHGEWDGGAGRMTREHQQRLDAVEHTWEDVRSVAQRHGVEVPLPN